MKKTTRSLLTTALILFCAGILLALCTSLYAKISNIEVFDVEKKARTIETLTVSIDDVLKKSPDANYVKQQSSTKFTRIDLTSFAGNVILTSGGQQTEILLEEANTNNLEYYVEGDALIIREVDPVGFMGFYIDRGGISFKGLRHTFNPGNAINDEKTITLKIPEGLELNQVDVYASIGDITLDGIFSGSVNVESGNGIVNVKNLKNPNGKLSIKGNFSDVHVENNLYLNCSISSHFGDINAKLLEDTNASTILDLWYGTINVDNLLPTSQYKLSITTSNGAVKHNSEVIGETLNHDGASAARISSSIVIGDFNLNYIGEKADHFVPTQAIPQVSSVPVSSDVSSDDKSTENNN